MVKTPTSDEHPKNDIAKRVITPKRRYFMPEAGVSVEAESTEDAIKQLEKLKSKKAEEVGDATE
jgi:hypothetical protein